MIILVTGGCGFIGSNLCEKLLQLNYKVICLDNLYSGFKKNIEHLLENPNFEFINHDITNPIYLKVDQIYHLACPASPKTYQLDGIKTIKTNVYGTINALEIAKNNKSRILLTSTSEIYGNPLISPQKEEHFGNVNTFGIRSCYDEGKRLAETLMFEYNKNHNVDIRIARIFNTYGPKMYKDDGRVVSNFINQCLENKDITIYGKGLQTRSFCYIDDMIDALIKLMNQDYSKPVNLGNPEELTIIKLAEKIKCVTNSNSKILFKDLPQDDPIKRKPDINKANTLLKWNPRINLDTGINRTIEYFKNI